ncbi:Bug family tripartite tricarboxylate transporter substrate binding protein [Pseudorhodoplanes sp.]|uniref:Bug family tripartite tricarboxylate transporter substrate binding protein n=1 Tax=Pseudorhodoplanes sp. TaxID=1934341 RepID=UPI003919E404
MFFRSLLSAAALVFAASAPVAAQDFPTRPITILVGLAPGGITDVMARLYAETVSRKLGQAVIVENRPAASGAVAAAALQNAQPDGYTLLLFSGAQHATIPALSSAASYDPVKGAEPVSLLFNFTGIVAVPADSPIKSMAEFAAYAKSKPGGLNFGSPGVGTPSHLAAAKLLTITGAPAQFVHYKGGSPMMADLVAGRLDVAWPSAPASKSFLLDKKLRALAVDAGQRWSAIADVPTLREAGFGEASVANWFAIAAAPGTPPAIIRKLNAAFVEAAQDPELKRKVEDFGMTVTTSTPEEMGKLMAKEAAEIRDLVQKLGLKQ